MNWMALVRIARRTPQSMKLFDACNTYCQSYRKLRLLLFVAYVHAVSSSISSERSLNPLAASANREMEVARAHYTQLQSQSEEGSKLVARLQKERRAELADFGESTKASLMHDEVVVVQESMALKPVVHRLSKVLHDLPSLLKCLMLTVPVF